MMEWLNDTYTWVTLSFALFAMVAFKFGRGPVIRALDTKIAAIRADLAAAEAARDQARALLMDFEARRAHANAEAERMIAQARASAEELRAREEKNLDELLRRKEQQLSERLTLLRDQAVDELRQVAARLAFEATEKMVTQHLDDQTRARLIDRALDHVTTRLN